ncbi:MAG TPA: HAMP domain-containing sensor histidine kinase [Actinomycetota bacterium]|nr:HAMP domain-containing sensor histidine kinase [Actinomycetota bacterium]
MQTIADDRRLLERWMTYIRLLGVVGGAIAIMFDPNLEGHVSMPAAWSVIIGLAFGTLLIWAMLRRVSSHEAFHRLALASFGFDVLMICAAAWTFSTRDPFTVWAILFLIPMDGALRYRLRGAVFSAALVAVYFAVLSARVAAINGDPFDVGTYLFVVALATLTAGITGTMAEMWHHERKAFIEQSNALAEMDRLKDRFLAVTSHEIRGPLTAIIGGVDTLKKRGDRLTPEQHQRMLDVASNQAHQLARLVDDLTVTSQLQAGKLSLEADWTTLEETIEPALQAAASKRRNHQLELFIEPLQCQIDRFRVAQVVRNLVENAYKYTADRTRVAVTAKAVEGGIAIKVADDGEGIPADKRDELFEAFSRIEETAAGREGVGLGLYVVSQLVATMGGRIDLTSSSKGTTFELFIPAATAKGEKPRLGLIEGGGAEGSLDL